MPQTDLAAFLGARLAEDAEFLREAIKLGERKRDAASEADILANMPAFLDLMADPAVKQMMQKQVALGYPPPNDAQRVLREIEAKRAILAEHSPDPDSPRLAHWCKTCDEGFYPCRTARLLAAVYADHPDYDPAWATGG